MTDRKKAYDALEELRAAGIQDSEILDYLVYNFLSGSVAKDAMESATEEFNPQAEEEESEDYIVCGVCGGDATICDGC